MEFRSARNAAVETVIVYIPTLPPQETKEKTPFLAGETPCKNSKGNRHTEKKVYFCGRNSKPTTNEKDSITDCPCSDDPWRHGARLLLEGKERLEKRLLCKVKRNQTM
jgi:hypothetical protein